MDDKEFWKYMEGDITGWTAYCALAKVLVRWHKVSGLDYPLWLAECLDSNPALQEDWAQAMKEAIEERGVGNRKIYEVKRIDQL